MLLKRHPMKRGKRNFIGNYFFCKVSVVVVAAKRTSSSLKASGIAAAKSWRSRRRKRRKALMALGTEETKKEQGAPDALTFRAKKGMRKRVHQQGQHRLLLFINDGSRKKQASSLFWIKRFSFEKNEGKMGFKKLQIYRGWNKENGFNLDTLIVDIVCCLQVVKSQEELYTNPRKKSISLQPSLQKLKNSTQSSFSSLYFYFLMGSSFNRISFFFFSSHSVNDPLTSPPASAAPSFSRFSQKPLSLNEGGRYYNKSAPKYSVGRSLFGGKKETKLPTFRYFDATNHAPSVPRFLRLTFVKRFEAVFCFPEMLPSMVITFSPTFPPKVDYQKGCKRIC